MQQIYIGHLGRFSLCDLFVLFMVVFSDTQFIQACAPLYICSCVSETIYAPPPLPPFIVMIWSSNQVHRGFIGELLTFKTFNILLSS